MVVAAVDYLKLLEGGNFIHLVAMVTADNDVSTVETHTLRLKASLYPWSQRHTLSSLPIHARTHTHTDSRHLHLPAS